jgi:hypothetical protein
MFLGIHQNVDDGVPDLARRPERPRMKSIVPYSPSTPKHAVDRAREPDRQTHEATRKRPLVVRLDEQMHMICLHREVHDPEPGARRSSERPPDFDEDALSPQVRHTARCSHGHVNWMDLLVLMARAMRHPSWQTRRFPPRATALSAARPKRDLLLPPSLHVNRLLIYNYRI